MKSERSKEKEELGLLSADCQFSTIRRFRGGAGRCGPEPAACVIVTVRPATLNVPVRAAVVVLAATV